jgi:hypothetical protein
VLHLLEHLEQKCTFFPRRLGMCTCILFACGCRVECRAQPCIFALQSCNRLLHQRDIGLYSACRVLPRICGVRRRILERSMEHAAAIFLPRGMQRVACTYEFGCIDTVIRVETEAARIDGALERAAGNAAGACRVRDAELGHGRVSVQ